MMISLKQCIQTISVILNLSLTLIQVIKHSHIYTHIYTPFVEKELEIMANKFRLLTNHMNNT